MVNYGIQDAINQNINKASGGNQVLPPGMNPFNPGQVYWGAPAATTPTASATYDPSQGYSPANIAALTQQYASTLDPYYNRAGAQIVQQLGGAGVLQGTPGINTLSNLQSEKTADIGRYVGGLQEKGITEAETIKEQQKTDLANLVNVLAPYKDTPGAGQTQYYAALNELVGSLSGAPIKLGQPGQVTGQPIQGGITPPTGSTPEAQANLFKQYSVPLSRAESSWADNLKQAIDIANLSTMGNADPERINALRQLSMRIDNQSAPEDEIKQFVDMAGDWQKIVRYLNPNIK